MSGANSRRRLRLADPLQGLLERGGRAVAWLGFWSAIALPVGYLPLLAVGWLDPAFTLVAWHVAAVLAGQFYGRGT